MQVAVRRDRGPAVDTGVALEVGERPTGLLDDHLDGGQVPYRHADRVDRPVDRALGHEHVAPEVPVPAGVPGAPGEAGDGLLEGEAEHGVLRMPHGRDVDTVAAGVRAAAALRPPAAVERRCRDDAEDDAAVLLERDEGGPDGDPARVVPRAVDRVDDPAPPSGARRALLLAEDRIAAALLAEHRADLVLDGAVGFGHRRQVGLRLDDEVARPEAAERDRIRRVREPKRELEVRAHPSGPGPH